MHVTSSNKFKKYILNVDTFLNKQNRNKSAILISFNRNLPVQMYFL